MLLFFTLLTYFHGEFSLSKAQLSDLNVCVCVETIYTESVFIFISGNLFVFLLMALTASVTLN